MPTTTEHLKALLINDGYEFAMVRKADLAALLQIAEADPHQGRFLDPLGELKSKIASTEWHNNYLSNHLVNKTRDAIKHGEERRRYMANNRALLARVSALESEGVDDQLEIGRLMYQRDKFEARLLRVARFKLKFPAIGALMDVTP